MKAIPILIAVLVSYGFVAGQELQSRVFGGKDISVISVEEAKKEASRDGFGESDFVAAAFNVKRLELLKLCFEESAMQPYYMQIFPKLPDDSFKHKLLYMKLMSTSTNIWSQWGAESDNGQNTTGRREEHANWFISMLHPVLPDLTVAPYVIATREKRVALAERYAKAAGLTVEGLPVDDVVENARRVWPPRPEGGATPLKGEGLAPKSNPDVPVILAGNPQDASVLPGGWALWASIASVATAAAGWLLLRSKRKKRG